MIIAEVVSCINNNNDDDDDDLNLCKLGRLSVLRDLSVPVSWY